MEDFVEKVVRRLREEPGFSRNRHYATFSSPEGRRALRIHRRLRSIERDLMRATAVALERAGERLRLTLTLPWHGRRTTWLTPSELRILSSDEAVRGRLALP